MCTTFEFKKSIIGDIIAFKFSKNGLYNFSPPYTQLKSGPNHRIAVQIIFKIHAMWPMWVRLLWWGASTMMPSLWWTYGKTISQSGRVCLATPQPTVSQCRPPALSSRTRTGRVKFNIYGGCGYLSLRATCIHTRDLALSSFSHTHTVGAVYFQHKFVFCSPPATTWVVSFVCVCVWRRDLHGRGAMLPLNIAKCVVANNNTRLPPRNAFDFYDDLPSCIIIVIVITVQYKCT